MLEWLRKIFGEPNKKRLVCEGRAYIRPVGRGIVFEEGEHKDRYLVDLIESLNGHQSGYGYLRVKAEWVPDDTPSH